MPNPTLPTTALLTDPGFLFWAPVGTTGPVNTVAGSVFTDPWPGAFVVLGLTDGGTTVTHSLTVGPIIAAEQIDPIAYRTTDRASKVEFQLKNYTASNLSRAFNGATLTPTGSGATLLTKVTLPTPGNEVRCMIGFESLDATVRWLAYQVINSGDVALAYQRAPANASIPWTAMCEKPSASQPVDYWTAGAARGA